MTQESASKKLKITESKYISGVLVWYYAICPREVWLMSREINPFQDFEPLDYGRMIHEKYYKKEKKEIALEGIRFDVIKNNVVYEIKTSERFLEAAKLQLMYYIYRLDLIGIKARGELHIPKKRKIIHVELTNDNKKTIEKAIKDIKTIISKSTPPPPRKIKYCRKCAYYDFCWS